MTSKSKPFWETKSLEQMNDQEWELLCDGCGKCCMVKLQDDDTDEIYTTSVACKLLETESCRCTNYKNRKKLVPACLVLRPLNNYLISILPETCAYRLLAQGDQLSDWHPLISGTPNSVIEAGISISGKVISEQHIHPDDLENHITD